MGYFFFTRHGQTFWNVANKICGATDIGLTEKGHEQARELGQKILEGMKSGEYQIDEILASPLSRAYDTAAEISEVTGIPMRAEKRLTEQNFGRYEGTPRDGAEFAVAKTHFADSFTGGESMMKMAQRIYNLLDDIREESGSTGKVYLLVAHNGIARIVNSYFCDMTNEEFSQFGIRNCEILRYDFR